MNKTIVKNSQNLEDNEILEQKFKNENNCNDFKIYNITIIDNIETISFWLMHLVITNFLYEQLLQPFTF